MEEREEKSNSFQRQTLLELQDTIHDAIRLVHRAHLEDCAEHRSSKQWGKNTLSDEVNEGIRLAQRKVSILIERVANEQLRADVKHLMKISTDVLFAKDENESRHYIINSSSVATDVFQKIGVVLREHY